MGLTVAKCSTDYFNIADNNVKTLEAKNYNNCGGINSNILLIKIQNENITNLINILNISIFANDIEYSTKLKYSIDGNKQLSPLITKESGSSELVIDPKISNSIFVIKFFLDKYPGTYTLTSQNASLYFNIKIEFVIDDRLIVSTSTNTTSINLNNKIIIPSIYLQSQSLIDYSDIGDTIFNIRDVFIYCKDKVSILDNCVYDKAFVDITNINQIKLTKFEISCPKIVTVLKGVGNTALEKAIYIYNNHNITLFKFGENLIEYSMFKYILARLLYGKFDIKYLLRKYYKKFLVDLSNSRFFNSVNFFTDKSSELYNYDRFFLDCYNK